MARSLTRTTSLVLLLGSACGDLSPTEQAEDEGCTPSRTMSEPCCPVLGVDACGAGLVCAALDGRTQPTCYAEYSRRDGSECTDDLLCVSQSCHPALDRCQASLAAPCDPELGCAPDPAGNQPSCVETFGSAICQ